MLRFQKSRQIGDEGRGQRTADVIIIIISDHSSLIKKKSSSALECRCVRSVVESVDHGDVGAVDGSIADGLVPRVALEAEADDDAGLLERVFAEMREDAGAVGRDDGHGGMGAMNRESEELAGRVRGRRR